MNYETVPRDLNPKIEERQNFEGAFFGSVKEI